MVYLKDTEDLENPKAYKINPLYSREIPKIDEEDSKKYGIFKIKEKIEEEYIYDLKFSHSIKEVLYMKDANMWIPLITYLIYRWKRNIEHAGESLITNVPLKPIMYVDIEDKIYYIESEDGFLYCSANRLNWYYYNTKPELRPYFNRIEKMIKFAISTEYP